MKLDFPKTEPFPGVSQAEWSDWRWQFKNALSSKADFAQYFLLSESESRALDAPAAFPVRSTPYYTTLASREEPRDPIRQMILPSLSENDPDGQQIPDPLGERKHSPVERIIHRYPDRILFLITDQCSLYCRYCLRKHFTGQGEAFIGSADYEAALKYIRTKPGVREIILSGGDPLTLGDAKLERVLTDLRAIEHIEIIRIASRMPVVCPMRITEALVAVFKKAKPVFFMTHFNHPRELTAESALALERLVDSGVPVFNQMVLLNGVNNHAAIIQALARRLLFLRVKPYYMFQCDPSQGSEHFRTPIEESEAIQKELWGKLSGLAMASLSVDIPGGGGKVGVVPSFEVSRTEERREYLGFDGGRGEYLAPKGTHREPLDATNFLVEWKMITDGDYGKSEA